MNYIVTIYRTTGTTLQRLNANTLAHAMQSSEASKKLRFVRKVELSVILETWEPKD